MADAPKRSVKLNAAIWAGAATDDTVTGTVVLTPTRSVDASPNIIMPASITADIGDTVDLAVCDELDGWGWRVAVNCGHSRIERWVLVPAGTETNLVDLPEVNPRDLGIKVLPSPWAARLEAVEGLADTAVQPDDIGTAAAADATDFATAAQGSKADAALPASNLDQATADLLANPASQLAEEVTAKIAPAGLPWASGTEYTVGDIAITALGHRVRCVTAHTSAARFMDDAAKWLPCESPSREPLLLQRAQLGRSGGLGIGATAVPVSLRFDDDHEVFHSTIYPLLTARGLPAGHATISDLTAQPWSDGDSAANVLTRNKNGVEVWSHGLDHKDPSPHDLTGAGGLYDQIVGSKATIESWGVQCQGWMQPGATPLIPGVTPYGTDGTTWESLDQYSNWLVRDTYPLSESYAWGVSRPVPTQAFHGGNHVTVSDGVTYSSVIQALELAILYGQGVELMAHSAMFGQPGNMTVSDFTNLLDWLVTKWNDGVIEMVTPSGMYFTDRSTNRQNFVRKGDFEGISTGDTSWLTWGNATIETSGGHTGSNFLRIPDGSSALPSQRRAGLDRTGLDGKTFVFEGWARPNTGGSGTVTRLLIQSYPSAALLNMSPGRSLSAGASWTRIRHAFSIPPGVTEFLWALGRNSGGGVDWDDVSIRQV